MKFTKFERLDKVSFIYSHIEGNDFALKLLAHFLTSDAYSNATFYLEWLLKRPVDQDDAFTGGNRYTLHLEGEKITIRPEWYYFLEESPTEDEESWKFETTKDKMINLLKRWIIIVGQDPLENKETGILPISIAIIQKNDEILIENVDGDPRFSRIVKDNKKAWAKIEKSKLFENYLKVEANTEDLFKIGMIFSKYTERKEAIWEWILEKAFEYGTKIPIRIFGTGYSLFYKKNDTIHLNCKYNQDTKDYDYSPPTISKNNLLELLKQWDEIINKEPFPKEVFIQEEDNKLIMTEIFKKLR